MLILAGEIILYFCIIFFAIILHECAHGWVAYLCGDSTAKDAGRLTMNPLKHVDPVGTIIVPAGLILLRFFGVPTVLFGWAKPVPVSFYRLRHPRRDTMLVGAAGPGSNLIVAVLAAAIVRRGVFPAAEGILGDIIFINILLAVFNLIPIPPLDGSRIVMGLLPKAIGYAYARLERYGIILVIALLYFGLFDRILIPAVVFVGNLLGVSL